MTAIAIIPLFPELGRDEVAATRLLLPLSSLFRCKNHLRNSLIEIQSEKIKERTIRKKRREPGLCIL